MPPLRPQANPGSPAEGTNPAPGGALPGGRHSPHHFRGREKTSRVPNRFPCCAARPDSRAISRTGPPWVFVDSALMRPLYWTLEELSRGEGTRAFVERPLMALYRFGLRAMETLAHNL